MKTEDQILREARALVEAGWIQGAYSKEIVGEGVYYCALGALYASGEFADFDFSRVRRRLAEAIGVKPYAITDWNDAHGRTKEEVLAAFDRAIEEVSSNGQNI